MKRAALFAGFYMLSLTFLVMACSEVDVEMDDGRDVDGLTLSGTVIVRTLDQPSGSQKQYLFINEDNQRMILDFEIDPLLVTGEKVEITGVMQGEKTIEVDSFVVLTPKPRRLDAPLVRSPKQHRVAVLATQEASVTQQQAFNAINGSVDSVNHFYAENSQNIDTFVAKVFKRYNISYTASDCQYDNTDNIADALINAFKNDGNNTSDYDHIVVVVPKSCGTDWSGAWAYVGSISDSGSVDFDVVSMYKDNSFDAWYLSHELGHNLGMNHARSMNCGSVFYKSNAGGCSFQEYGNYNDVMGSGEGVYFSAAYQRFMGWIGASNVATAGKSGTFNLQPADGAMCGVRAVRIPIPGESGNYFYVEYRHARSDSRYAGTGALGSTRQNAVLITRSAEGQGGSDSSFTDRVELGTTRYLGATQNVRYDLGAGVAVKVLSMGGAFAQVFIEMPGSAVNRNDSGAPIPAETDGSNGSKTCGNSDACPSDPNKTDPGICGCGVSDLDTDKDGTADCQDGCNTDPLKFAPGQCGCGVPEGTCSGNASLYQAEKFTAQSGCKIATNNAGYTGTGFVDYGGNGTWMEWNNINAAAAGHHQLTFRYANGSAGARQSAVIINGVNVGNVAFAATGGWTKWGTAVITASLRAGNNTIRVLANTGSGGPNLDSVELKSAMVDGCPNDPNKTAPGTCGCGVADTDSDKDGTADCDDGCKSDPSKTAPGSCGCGVPEGTCVQAPAIKMSKSTYAVNEAIVVNYSGLPGNSTDWVGIYKVGTSNSSYLQYIYSGGKASGTMTFKGRSAGSYEARLFFKDSYTLAAKVSFIVK